jgi:nitroreductase
MLKIMLTLDHLNDIIRKRRSVFPPVFNEKEISKETITQILENANWAPTHKLTEPWRFQILRGVALQRLSAFLVEDYKTHTPVNELSEVKLKKIAENPLRSACVIMICLKRHERLPEWEELAAVAMAVQNMWLTCTALEIGSYWSSPNAITRMGGFLELAEDEKCLGLFYMGYSDIPLPEGKRKPIADKVVWVNT